MAEWAEVNKLQAEIARAERQYANICAGLKRSKVEALAKKEELKNLYDQQDRLVKDILGPRALYDIEKKLEEAK